MPQQKVVIKISVNCEKCRSKALKIASGFSGVESLSWTGDDKNQIEVVGDGIDPACLTMLFRKKMGYSELISVGPVPKKDDDQKEKDAALQIPVWGYYNYHPYMCEIRDPNSHNCSIM